MPKFFLDKTQLFAAFLTSLLVGLFFSLATHCYYSDSEIWLLTLSQRAFNPGELISIYFKWLFHAVTKTASFFVATNLDLYTATRWLYAVIAIAALAFNALSFAKIFNDKKLFLPVMIFTLSSSLFFNQGFRIRADILALFFHSLFIWTVVTSKNFGPFKIALLSFLNLALLLTTPKAVIFFALHGILGGFYSFLSQDRTSQIKGRSILLSVLAPCTLGLTALIVLSLFLPSHSLLVSFKGAVDFYLKSFDAGLGGAGYFRRYDFMYLARFFETSLAHTVLFLFWLFSFFKAIIYKPQRTEDHLVFDLSTAVLLIFLFLYNQKLPFFLGPFLTPVLAHQFCVFWLSVKKIKWPSLATGAVLVACTALCIRQYSINIKLNSNSKQRAVIAELDAYKIKNPQISLYDVIGLLPLNNSYYYFMGPGEVSRRETILAALKKKPPDIYLYSLKNVFFEPSLNSFLEAEYWQYEPGIWLKATNIHLDKKKFFANDILRIKDQTYWLTRGESNAAVFSWTTGKDITSHCYFLNKSKQMSQSDIFWIAIPLEDLKIAVVQVPPLSLSANPYYVFRFDTSF